MLTKRNALLAAGAAVLVALAGDRAASAADGNWALYENGALPADAVSGGIDSNGQTLYFCRVYQPGGAYQPGKVNRNLGSCRYAYGGQEVSNPLYEAMGPHWEWSYDGGLGGPSPYQGGTDSDNQPLFVCRAYYQGGLHPGKLKSGVGCYIPYGGNEILLNNYQVLQDDLPMTHDYNHYSEYSWLDIRGGYEANQTTYLTLCVAYYNDGSTQPGKYSSADHNCHFSYAGREMLASYFDLVFLRTVSLVDSWTQLTYDFPVGEDTNGDPLYACTGKVNLEPDFHTQLGKFRQDFRADDGNRTCHVGYADLEWNADNSFLVD